LGRRVPDNFQQFRWGLGKFEARIIYKLYLKFEFVPYGRGSATSLSVLKCELCGEVVVGYLWGRSETGECAVWGQHTACGG
jgi:hypothetical protein